MRMTYIDTDRPAAVSVERALGNEIEGDTTLEVKKHERNGHYKKMLHTLSEQIYVNALKKLGRPHTQEDIFLNHIY